MFTEIILIKDNFIFNIPVEFGINGRKCYFVLKEMRLSSKCQAHID